MKKLNKYFSIIREHYNLVTGDEPEYKNIEKEIDDFAESIKEKIGELDTREQVDKFLLFAFIDALIVGVSECGDRVFSKEDLDENGEDLSYEKKMAWENEILKSLAKHYEIDDELMERQVEAVRMSGMTLEYL